MSETNRRWSVNYVISDTLFPDVNFRDIPPNSNDLGAEIMTSLPLQMLLYFNILYYPCWSSVLIYVLSVKFWQMEYLPRYLYLTVLSGALVIEAIRLYVGYFGNLKENVPNLAGFWLITLLLAAPLHLIMLASPYTLRSGLELAVVAPQTLLALAQLTVGYGVVLRMAQHQAVKFRADKCQQTNSAH